MVRASRDELGSLAALAERAVHAEAGRTAFARGLALLDDGRVRNLRHARGVITARVRSTRRYHVVVALDDDLTYRCDCPVGEDGGFCAHCVATLLAWIDAVAPGRVERGR